MRPLENEGKIILSTISHCNPKSNLIWSLLLGKEKQKKKREFFPLTLECSQKSFK